MTTKLKCTCTNNESSLPPLEEYLIHVTYQKPHYSSITLDGLNSYKWSINPSEQEQQQKYLNECSYLDSFINFKLT